MSENVILYHHLVSPGVLHFRWIKSLGLFLLRFGLNNVQTLPELLSHLKSIFVFQTKKLQSAWRRTRPEFFKRSLNLMKILMACKFQYEPVCEAY